MHHHTKQIICFFLWKLRDWIALQNHAILTYNVPLNILIRQFVIRSKGTRTKNLDILAHSTCRLIPEYKHAIKNNISIIWTRILKWKHSVGTSLWNGINTTHTSFCPLCHTAWISKFGISALLSSIKASQKSIQKSIKDLIKL